MTRQTARLTLVALVVSVAALAAAGPDPLARRVTLDLKAMAPSDAFRTIGDAIGLKVDVDPTVTAPVDIVVRNVRARTALDTICDSIDCRWSLVSGVLRVSPLVDLRPPTPRSGRPVSSAPQREQLTAMVARSREALASPLPANLRFENASLEEVSQRLSQVLGTPCEVRARLATVKTLTADFSHRTVGGVMADVAKATGTEWFVLFPQAGTGQQGPAITVAFTSTPPKPPAPAKR